MNKDTLKKHHFWILLGLVPLLVLIAVITITSGVGAAIADRRAQIDTAKKDLQSKLDPKPDDLLKKLDKQAEQLGTKRVSLWKENWDRQIGLVDNQPVPERNLFRWPNSVKLHRFNYTRPPYIPAGSWPPPNHQPLKFGDPIPNTTDEYLEFQKREIYLAEFSNARPGDPRSGTGMADRVYPTQFAGGSWDRVLRHVVTPDGWGAGLPLSEDLWLALEDIWVQRAMLEAVRSVNDDIGTFRRIPRVDPEGKAVADSPLERTFQSRVWRVDLKVTERESDRRQVLSGELTNVTDRLQLLGAGNVMVLRVWLQKGPNAQPFDFKIGGEYVPGRGTLKIAVEPEHVLPAGLTAAEIDRVEQVFDARTVPVRRIDRLVLGQKDSRHAALPLKMPKFPAFQKLEEAAAAAAAATGPMSEGGPAASSSSPMGGRFTPGASGPGGPGPGMPGPGGTGEGGAMGTGREGGGTIETVLVANRQRYVEVTEQVRRMPVAIVLVVDQSYMQDVLLAYANSPARFQITQVHWQRFRGTLAGVGTGGGSYPGGGGEGEAPLFSAPGTAGSGFYGTPEGGGLGRPGPGMPGPGMPGPGMPGPGMPGPGMPGPGMPGPGMPGPGFGPGGSLTTGGVSEHQMTAGLIEVTIYGTVTLYEKYQPPSAEVPPAGTSGTTGG